MFCSLSADNNYLNMKQLCSNINEETNHVSSNLLFNYDLYAVYNYVRFVEYNNHYVSLFTQLLLTMHIYLLYIQWTRFITIFLVFFGNAAVVAVTSATFMTYIVEINVIKWIWPPLKIPYLLDKLINCYDV